MGKLNLSLAIAPYDKVQSILDGSVEAEGIDFTCIRSPGGETFWRQLKYGEFDVSEMSFSSFLIMMTKGWPWVAIPYFPNRVFFHTGILCNVDSNIRQPADLVGKKFGVPEYQISAALWCRGILQHIYNVPPESLEWYVERSEQLSHGGVTGFKPPSKILLHRIPPERTLAKMLLGGEIDAVLIPRSISKPMLDRSDWSFDSNRIKLLFDDPIKESIKYYGKTGIIPINHTIIIREEIVKKHPWVPLNILNAFQRAKESCLQHLANLPVIQYENSIIWSGAVMQMQRKILGEDPFPCGVSKNRKVIETMIQYSYEQGLISRPLQIEELFARSTLET